MAKYKVKITGYAYIEADTEQEAEEQLNTDKYDSVLIEIEEVNKFPFEV